MYQDVHLMLSDMPAYVSAVLFDALVILGHLLCSNFFGYIVDFLVPEYQITQYFLPAHGCWNVLAFVLLTEIEDEWYCFGSQTPDFDAIV